MGFDETGETVVIEIKDLKTIHRCNKFIIDEKEKVNRIVLYLNNCSKRLWSVCLML